MMKLLLMMMLLVMMMANKLIIMKLWLQQKLTQHLSDLWGSNGHTAKNRVYVSFCFAPRCLRIYQLRACSPSLSLSLSM